MCLTVRAMAKKAIWFDLIKKTKSIWFDKRNKSYSIFISEII